MEKIKETGIAHFDRGSGPFGVFVKEWGIKVEYDRGGGSGRWYFGYNELLSPEPNIPPDSIDLVTLREEIEQGLRREGVYRSEDAQTELIAVTHTRAGVRCQEISIKGPSVAAVKEIRTLFRQGRLQPKEDWEAESEKAATSAPSTQ